MAGLLDLFSTTDPDQRQANLALAAGLLSGSFAKGVAGMNQVMADAPDRAMRRQLVQSQIDENASQAELRKQAAAAALQKIAEQQRIRDLLSSAGRVSPGMGASLPNGTLPPEMSMPQQPALQQAGKIDYQRLIQAGVPPELVKSLADSANYGRPKVARVEDAMDAQGRPIKRQLDDYGNPVGGDLGQWKAPVSVDLGGSQSFIDPVTMQQRGGFAKSQSPDNKASQAVAWANNELANKRFAFDQGQVNKPQFHDGQWITAPTAANPTGTSVQVPGFSKPLTETQGKATTFAARMQDADKIITALGDKVSPSSVAQAGYRSEFPAWLPGGQLLGAGVTAANQSFNPAVSDEAQQYRQAQENWVTANLRQESGAAISKDEMDKDVRKWFPQPGEGEAVKKQKAQARAVASRAMMAQAGPGANRVPEILNGPNTTPQGNWGDNSDPLGLFKKR
jgi:hypothetical protein